MQQKKLKNFYWKKLGNIKLLVSYNVKDLAMKAENNQIINELQELAPHLASAGS